MRSRRAKVASSCHLRRGRRRPGGAPRPARRRRRVCVGRRGLRQWRHRAQPRAAGHGPEPRSRPSRRCGSRSATRPPTTRSITCSPSCPRSSSGCGADVRVLVAMSGGVDSSVAAALLAEAGPRRRRRHPEAVGRRVRQRVLLGGRRRRRPARGRTARPRPPRLQLHRRLRGLGGRTVRCRPRRRAAPPIPASSATAPSSSACSSIAPSRLGFDALATGHHARVVPDRRRCGVSLRRGADPKKDQSYVLSMLSAAELARVVLPVGELTKAEVRARAARHRPAHRRQARQPGRVLHPFRAAADAGSSPSAWRCTAPSWSTLRAATSSAPSRRRARDGGAAARPGVAVDGHRRYALTVDVRARRITVGTSADAVGRRVALDRASWVGPALEPRRPGLRPDECPRVGGRRAPGRATRVVFDEPQPLVAPGQTVALYDAADADAVVGAAVATAAEIAEIRRGPVRHRVTPGTLPRMADASSDADGGDRSGAGSFEQCGAPGRGAARADRVPRRALLPARLPRDHRRRLRRPDRRAAPAGGRPSRARERRLAHPPRGRCRRPCCSRPCSTARP